MGGEGHHGHQGDRSEDKPTEKPSPRVTLEDNDTEQASPTVIPGNVRIRGHFSGVVTTSSHCLEVTLPVEHEVPYCALDPALSAFMHAAEMEEARRAANEGAAEVANKALLGFPEPAELWQKLRVLLSLEAHENESRANELLRMESTTTQDKLSPRDTPVASIQEVMESVVQSIEERYEQLVHKDAALLIDYNAKEALLSDVMMERDQLKAELDALKEPQNHQHEGMLSRMMHHGSKIFHEGLHQVEDHLLGHHHAGTINGNKENASDVSGGVLALHGHFVGTVRTKEHVLEIIMPIEGPVPGSPLLTILRALAANPTGSSEVKKAQDIWRKLIPLLGADSLEDPIGMDALSSPDKAKVADSQKVADLAGQQRLAELEESHEKLKLAEQESQQEVLRLRRKLDEAASELLDTHNDLARMQSGMVQLRARNATLVSCLASGETSAQKLRETSHEAGSALPLPGNSPVRQDLSIMLADLRDPEKAVARRRLANSSAGPLDSAAEALRAIEAPELAPRNCSSLAVRTAPHRDTPVFTRLKRLEATDQALQSHLRDLERWASELRTLRSR